MKTKSLAALLTIACSAVVLGETPETAPLQIYPKNLARQHVGANLFVFNQTTRTYAPTEAAAAWLDDDVTTGAPLPSGTQYYLLALAEPELVTNFALSAQPAGGTITLHVGDEPTPPGNKSWIPVVRDVALDQVNERKLRKPISRLAKYVLIETKLEDPSAVYSLYLYGDKPAVAYDLNKREETVDVRAVFGPHASEATSFNVAGLYARAVVSQADSGDGYVSWQKALDDNPESGLRLGASGDKAGATIRYPASRAVSRIAVLTEPGAKGRLDVFVDDVATEPPAAAVADRTPAASLTLDGTNARSAVEFPQVQAGTMMVRWTPDNGTDTVVLREMNVFGDPKLSTYAVNLRPEAIAEYGRNQRLADSSKDGKSFKDAKEAAEPIAQLLPQNRPYLPGSLGFPPNISGLNEPVSP
jgi:hypothetical protein